MPKFRKIPVEIEAVQFDGDNVDQIKTFTGGDAFVSDGSLYITTLEGPLRASPLDWIAKGVQGEHYPIKPSVFAKTYEPA